MVLHRQAQRHAALAVVVAALGYFVDIYDLILFGTVRKPSLVALGYTTKEALTEQGVYLINCQMGGMLLGGILWGILGDKRGRLSVLFGSIITYSLANIANGYVDSIGGYAACRLVAGLGLAGELGAGITLVSELMDKRRRGIATAIVAGFGICGGIAAGIVGGGFPTIYEGASWRHAYYIGGGLGLVLLLLRIGVVESGMFHQVRARPVARGNFFWLFRSPRRALRYLGLICIGLPIWYVVGILMTFCDRVGGDLGLHPEPRPATALMICYAGLAVGDVGSGLVSQALGSRRRALWIFIAGTALSVGAYFALGGISLTMFYVMCAVVGLFAGYWAVFVTVAAEQYGTNLRATVATTTPNFVRGSVVLVTSMFEGLGSSLGIAGAAAACGVLSVLLAGLGMLGLRETFGVDLDYVEE